MEKNAITVKDAMNAALTALNKELENDGFASPARVMAFTDAIRVLSELKSNG